MKKKLVAISLVVAMLAVAVIGGSLAYFTDTAAKTNTFTVGSVKIELLESSLHRENAGVPNGTTSDSELWSNVAMDGQPNDKYTAGTGAAYSDDQIKANAAQYSCNDIKLNPGQSYHKMPYVVNTGKNDAYIRIRVMIPADLDTAILNSSMYTTSAISRGEFSDMVYDNSGTVDRGGIKYNVYTFTRIAPLAPEEMTYWNVWGTIHMDSDVTNEEIEALFGEGKAYADGSFPVLVEADAIQADGFDSATEAFAAFDKK